MSDLVDPNKAKRLGQMAGVEAIVVGTIADLGNQLDVDARMIDIESTRMLLGTSVTIAKDPTVIGMLERGRTEASVLGPGSSPGSGPVTVPQEVGTGKAVTAEGLAFQARGCRRSADNLLCTVAFINM